jgi:hypothetical protein
MFVLVQKWLLMISLLIFNMYQLKKQQFKCQVSNLSVKPLMQATRDADPQVLVSQAVSESVTVFCHL